MQSCNHALKEWFVAKNQMGKNQQLYWYFFELPTKKGILLGEHGFTKQPISAKANLSAGFLFYQKNITKQWQSVLLELKKNTCHSNLALFQKPQKSLKTRIRKNWHDG